MSRKVFFKSFVYLAVGACLSLAEKKTGLYGLGLAFCVAIIFCRENPLLAILTYMTSNALVHFDLMYCVVVACGAFCVLIYVLIARKAKKKYRIWANAIVITISQTPTFFLFANTTTELIYASVSPVVSVLIHYIFIVASYPLLVRGAQYKLTDREKSFLALAIIPIALGLASFEIYGVSLFYFTVALGCLLLLPFGGISALGFSVAMGFGGALVTLSPYSLGIAVAMGGTVCIMKNANKYLCGLGVMGAYTVALYLFQGTLDAKSLAPVAVACLIVFIPNKIFYRARGYSQSYKGKFALRTVANRDREEVGEKLSNIARAFRKMQSILESEETFTTKPEDSANAIFEVCCSECGKFGVCKEKLGDARKYYAKLLSGGKENGKVNLLDVDGALGATCIKLPKVINTANACLREYSEKRERRTGIEQGREMVTENLAGTALLLEELATTVNKGFGFDYEGEKLITDELACANIVASDAAIYGKGDKVAITIRECDEKKPELIKIISEFIGSGMYVSERASGINGTVNLVFKPNPLYGVLYGEKSLSAEEDKCGDASQAVKIASDKLMFVLSDGMGTGAEAHNTGASTINLIETFYRAGFGHRTIFGCVAKLLALRTKETFSALDVAVMDTQTGEIDFIKQGGRESYLITKRGVETIEGEALPMGIIAESEPTIIRRKAENNDLAVLISDGIADVLNSADMTEIIVGLNTLNPQTIVEKIVENAKKRQNGHIDDMTAMAFRVVKNPPRAS